jgi:cellobiose phosphorylase
LLANPIAVTDRLAQALPRQRNAYFSSSDAAFPDRYAASDEWSQVKAGTVGVEGGWRIYSSGPGIYAKLVIGHVLGRQRQWGRRTARPLLPQALQDVTVELESGSRGAGLPPIPSDAASGKK